MSRFFQGDSSSEYSSGDESTSSGSSVAAPQAPTRGDFSRFDFSDSSSDDDVKAVVLTGKERRFKFVGDAMAQLRTSLNKKDWESLNPDFVNLVKVADPNSGPAKKYGYPPGFFKLLVQLEDAVNGISREDYRSLPKTQAQGLTRLKTAMKRQIDPFESGMKRYRTDEEFRTAEDAAVFDSEGSDESDESDDYSDESDESDYSDDESETDSDDDLTDSDFDSDSSSSSDSSGPQLTGRARWVKRPTTSAKPKVEKDAEKRAQAKKREKDDVKKAREITVKSLGSDEHSKLEASVAAIQALRNEEWSVQRLEEEANQAVTDLAKKTTDIEARIERLSVLCEIAADFGPEVAINMLVVTVATRLSWLKPPTNFTGQATGELFIDNSTWKLCIRDLTTIMNYLEEDPSLCIVIAGEYDPETAHSLGFKFVPISFDISLMMEQIQREYIKSLQHIDNFKSEYNARVVEEGIFTVLVERAFVWFSNIAKKFPNNKKERSFFEGAACRAAVIIVGHMYYKHDSIVTIFRKAALTSQNAAEAIIIAASAAAQALEDVRKQVVTIMQDHKDDESKTHMDTKVEKVTDANVVGEDAAKIAISRALSSGKTNYATAAEILAKNAISELANREGNLLQATMIASNLQGVMESICGDIASMVFNEAEANGVDLGPLSSSHNEVKPIDTVARISTLAHYVYSHCDDNPQIARQRNIVLLFQIYHHALHDRYTLARKLFIMSGIQNRMDSLHDSTNEYTSENLYLRTAYYRALTQIGLAAFRAGRYAECHDCLVEVCRSGQTKELLAQGISMMRHGVTRDKEAHAAELMRVFPYHMHINVDLIDTCHTICAALLEVPNMAAAEHDSKRRDISRVFRSHRNKWNERDFHGPPDTNRDRVVGAAIAMERGDWQQAVDLITNLRMWNLWTDRNIDEIKANLTQQIKITTFTTYLHSFCRFYDSISRDSLAIMFDLPPTTVESIILKAIYSQEIPGKWDQPSATLLVLKSNPSRLQKYTEELVSQFFSIADINITSLVAKFNNVDPYFERSDDKYGHPFRNVHRYDRSRYAGNRSQFNTFHGTRGHRYHGRYQYSQRYHK